MKHGWFLEEVLLQQQPGNDAILTNHYEVTGRSLQFSRSRGNLAKWHRYRGTYLTNRESYRLLAWIILSWKVVLALLQEWFDSLKGLLRYYSLKTVKNRIFLQKCAIISLSQIRSQLIVHLPLGLVCVLSSSWAQALYSVEKILQSSGTVNLIQLWLH